VRFSRAVHSIGFSDDKMVKKIPCKWDLTPAGKAEAKRLQDAPGKRLPRAGSDASGK
jgi:hypothetical protein